MMRHWIQVDSTAINYVGYDEDELLIQFADGDIYAYSGVPEPVFRQLLRADSAGHFFQHHIRERYPARKLAAASRGFSNMA